MFCRNCGKELSDKAVACIGCGMNPHDGNAHCPACGVATKDKQIVCTACGSSLKGGSTDGWPTGPYIGPRRAAGRAGRIGSTDGWPTGPYIGLLVLSFIIPLVGWIYGGIQIKNAAEGSQRKSQAWHFVIAGIVGAVFNIILMSAD